MAEVTKNKNDAKEYKVKELANNSKKLEEEIAYKKEDKKSKPVSVEKKSLWTKFRIFCHGVKSETVKIHWTTKNDMIKYSVATIIFVIFCAIFFYAIDVLFAFIQSLF